MGLQQPRGGPREDHDGLGAGSRIQFGVAGLLKQGPRVFSEVLVFDRKTISDVDVRGKRVLVRVDFNVPMKDGVVTDDSRVRAALPTIEQLVERGARVVLMSHLGRPKGEPDARYSLRPVCAKLQELFGRPVAFVDETVGAEAARAVSDLGDGDVLMLENVRFNAGEKTNDPEFARQLAELGDIYVDDAFGAAHRAHASTAGVADYLPAYAGLLLAREVETLTAMLSDPARPFVAILGGSKVSDKFGVIDRLIDTVDALLIGGGMAFTFLAAQGVGTGRSIVEADWVAAAGEMLGKAAGRGVELVLPVDFVVAREIADAVATSVVPASGIPSDLMGLDIGPESSALFAGTIANARTIFWNGPMGVFEIAAFEAGTKAVAEAVGRNREAVSVIGGGDSVAALKKFGLEDQVTFVSTGGGASMQLVEGKPLPGVEALLKKESA